ncbi:MAG: hypothetical protein IT579_22445 [Verrucomicrobia subdivision 3 bacterium]|nr:hypothetical protein [Verrucomicrobiota bacterium]MCC6823495.1 hypothetical protein [Limisphaerales bacterium]
MRGLNCIRKLLVAMCWTMAVAFRLSGQPNVPPEILATDATNYVNQEVVVRDVVVQVTLRPTLALLNLNQHYPDSPLTCVIRGKNTNNFPELERFLGQRVEVSGRITTYQGRPQIILKTPGQIRILDAVPTSLPPSPLVEQPATKVKEVAANLPAATVPAPLPPVAAQPNRAVWWIVGLFAVLVVLLRSLVAWFWRRRVRQSGPCPPPAALVQLPAPDQAEAATDPSTAEEWKQRALMAEAMAGRQGQILREKLMPELAEFAKQSLVQGLYAQRNTLLETQRVAQQALVEMETRLAALQLSLPERIRAYEQRIGELEKEVETQGAEMRELTRATLALVRRKLETERERERLTSRFN